MIDVSGSQTPVRLSVLSDTVSQMITPEQWVSIAYSAYRPFRQFMNSLIDMLNNVSIAYSAYRPFRLLFGLL